MKQTTFQHQLASKNNNNPISQNWKGRRKGVLLLLSSPPIFHLFLVAVACTARFGLAQDDLEGLFGNTTNGTDNPFVNTTLLPTIPENATGPTLAPSASLAPSLPPSIGNLSTSVTEEVDPSTSSPSITPMPTAEPTRSHAPTFTPAPGTSYPSSVPSFSGTLSPTWPVQNISCKDIEMRLSGDLNTTMDESQKLYWVNITNQHIVTFWNDVHEAVPDIAPIFVYNVVTKVTAQTLNVSSETLDEAEDRKPKSSLDIKYEQEILFSITDPDYFTGEDFYDGIEEMDYFLFVLPFDYNAEDYVLELIDKMSLDSWLHLQWVRPGGTTTAPTASPTVSPKEKEEIGTGPVVGISVTLILGSILLVAVGWLLQDRQKKELYFRNIIAQEQQNHEIDNAGQPVDWSNPYTGQVATRSGGTVSGSDGPADDTTAAASIVTRSTTTNNNSSSNNIRGVDHQRAISVMTAASESSTTIGSNQRTTSTSSLPPLPSSRPPRNATDFISHPSLPPMAPPVPRPSRLSNGSLVIPGDHLRHTSVADTEITDITYSDGFGGDRSDNGSDAGGPRPNTLIIPEMATIDSDQAYHDPTCAPLHIPSDYENDDDHDDTESTPEDDQNRPDGSLLGLTYSIRRPSLSAFDLQIEELE